MYEFHSLKNESINFFIDSGYYVDYQINKREVSVWFVMLFYYYFLKLDLTHYKQLLKVPILFLHKKTGCPVPKK
jgi:hypothetical protein